MAEHVLCFNGNHAPARAITGAGADDAHDIATLHAESWRMNYEGILPATYLRGEVEEERRIYWARALMEGKYSWVQLAKRDRHACGFIALTLATEPGCDATIEHLHVASQAQGLGLGRALIANAVEHLMALGLESVCLRVFEANSDAIGFYESLGGTTDGYGTDPFSGADAPDRRIVWHDLPALLRSCRGHRRS